MLHEGPLGAGAKDEGVALVHPIKVMEVNTWLGHLMKDQLGLLAIWGFNATRKRIRQRV